MALLGESAAWQRDDAGRLRVLRDHRLATSPDVTVGIYVQRATEHTHGLSSTLPSNVAVRTGEIAAGPARTSGGPVRTSPRGAGAGSRATESSDTDRGI